MTRHLETCPKRTATFTPTRDKYLVKPHHLLQLRIDGLYAPDYWMYVEIPSEAPLDMLDNFLRKSWLECCGHLSRFEIRGISYSSYADASFGGKTMDIQIGKVLHVGDECTYEYDFGSTTDLRLKVQSEREGVRQKKVVTLLAHNVLPTQPCSVCGKPATQICSECSYDGSGFLCETCATEHECGEEMLLPVINSPRMGVCGYDGPGL